MTISTETELVPRGHKFENPLPENMFIHLFKAYSSPRERDLALLPISSYSLQNIVNALFCHLQALFHRRQLREASSRLWPTRLALLPRPLWPNLLFPLSVLSLLQQFGSQCLDAYSSSSPALETTSLTTVEVMIIGKASISFVAT
jgi:hypothetical protein